MITCEQCGKFNLDEDQIGDHWICNDCKVNNTTEKEGDLISEKEKIIDKK